MSTRKTPPPYIVLPQGEPLQRALWRLGYEAAWDDLKERCYHMYIRAKAEAFINNRVGIDVRKAMIDIEAERMRMEAMAFDRRVEDYNRRIRIAEALPDIADRAG